MTFTRHKFNLKKDQEFYKTLRTRVNRYFSINKLSKQGNTEMYMKSVVMILLFVVPFVVLLTGVATQPWAFFGLWTLMGIGAAGIGLSIMHDANHGAYSKNKTLNKILGMLMNFIGGNAEVWKMQHNVLHHTYTNINEADDDIKGRGVLRFSPQQQKRFMHRFQFLYAWFLYSLMTLVKVVLSDFSQLVKYRNIKLIRTKKEFAKMLTGVVFWKVIYLSYILVLPMLIVPVSPWMVLSGFILMQLVTGFSLAIVFQLAHVMPTTAFPDPKDGTIEDNWAVHQLKTTTNFAPKSRIMSWFIGGLNYQVEHHLFSNICHVHYRRISKIVAKTAREYGVPYHSQPNFVVALWNHMKMLYKLGRVERA